MENQQIFNQNWMAFFYDALNGKLQRQEIQQPIQESFVGPFDYLDDESLDEIRDERDLNPQFTINTELYNQPVHSVCSCEMSS